MANTTNFNWETPDDTDLVKDGALAMRTLGNAIDTSLVDLKGGTTGQVLSKNTNTDMDFVWTTPNVGDITEVQAGTGISVASGTGPIPVVTNTVATTFDAKGDLVVGTGADTFAKRTVGANETRLVADSVETTGVKWVSDTTNYAITAKGDLLAGTAADTVGVLTLGTNNQILTVDTSTATGMKWAAAPSSTPSFVGVQCYKTGEQTISTATLTAVTFDAEYFDTDAFHSNTTNTSRITIPSGKGGKYAISGSVGFIANATGVRGAYLYKNGNLFQYMSQQGNAGSASSQIVPFSTIIDLVATDYIEIFVNQTSGGNLNVRSNEFTFFNAVYLGA